ncbi:MAG TPA: serine hydrolase domain-containing protein [Candidatus Angelobacter sp.]|nr:serine hydrolase domain-containing protein [Candidatus Angelobacter sp.]
MRQIPPDTRISASMLVVLAMLGTAGFCVPAIAQLPPSQALAIDTLARTYLADHHVPGISIAVIDHGNVLTLRAYGLADIENNVPATPDTVYRIASLSKPITATATMKLVVERKLDLDLPVQKYCPSFPSKKWPITTRELLSHQSGIRDYRNVQETVNTRHFSSISEALTQFENDPLQFEPGTKMQYTSYGYIVVGCVIEGASRASYADYMQRAIFDPAGMHATRLDDVFAILPHRARGYSLTADGKLQNAIFVDASNKPPGSGINSSARDMGAFVAALYSGKLVSKSALDEMLTPSETRDGKSTIYGLGFFRGGPISSYHGLQEAGHPGDQQGFSSVLYLLPQREFGVVILANLESSPDLLNLARRIYDIISTH